MLYRTASETKQNNVARVKGKSLTVVEKVNNLNKSNIIIANILIILKMTHFTIYDRIT